ncbi:hypothetical protein J9A39_12105, partial [Klebsiella pneumoniae]
MVDTNKTTIRKQQELKAHNFVIGIKIKLNKIININALPNIQSTPQKTTIFIVETPTLVILFFINCGEPTKPSLSRNCCQININYAETRTLRVTGDLMFVV